MTCQITGTTWASIPKTHARADQKFKTIVNTINCTYNESNLFIICPPFLVFFFFYVNKRTVESAPELKIQG